MLFHNYQSVFCYVKFVFCAHFKQLLSETKYKYMPYYTRIINHIEMLVCHCKFFYCVLHCEKLDKPKLCKAIKVRLHCGCVCEGLCCSI